MLSRGFSVDHIVSCGVSNYLEFKAIDDIYMNDLEFQTSTLKMMTTISNDEKLKQLYRHLNCSNTMF